MMKNETMKKTVMLCGLLILASTLSIISYLVLTQFLAFSLQVIDLMQQGSNLSVGDVVSATWQSFGIKLLLPIFAVASWYVVVEFFTNVTSAKKHAFNVSGAMVIFSAIMLGLTWSTFADVPMIIVLVVPAIVVAVIASQKTVEEATVKTEVEATQASESAVGVETTLESVATDVATHVRVGRTRRQPSDQKPKQQYRRYL